MSTRENSNDTSSSTGKSYPAGSAASTANSTSKGVSLTKSYSASTTSLLAQTATNPIEVHADYAVFDTVTGKYLFPGRDYNPGDLNRK